MRACLSVVFALLSLVISSAAALATPPEDILRLNKSAILYLEVRNSSGTVLRRATGFIVSHDGYVITAAHIMTDPRSAHDASERVWAAIGQRYGAIYPLSFRERDEGSDVAVWQLPQMNEVLFAVTLSAKRVRVFDTVMALGFPKEEGLTPSPNRKIANLSSVRGFYKVDVQIDPGNAGGPVFNEEGEVVGIVQGGALSGADDTDIIPIASAAKLLEKRGALVRKSESAAGCPHRQRELICILVYHYSGQTVEAEKFFNDYRTILTAKARSVRARFSGATDAKYLERLTVSSYVAVSRPTYEDIRSRWTSDAALEVIDPFIQGGAGDVASQIFLGELGSVGSFLGLELVAVQLHLSPAEYMTIKDSHSLVTLFALAMDA